MGNVFCSPALVFICILYVQYNTTPLLEASRNGSSDKVHCLLDNGADPNIQRAAVRRLAPVTLNSFAMF